MRTTQTNKIIIGPLLGILGCITAAQGALLVYEGFDYSPGADVTTSLNGGAGFTGIWTPGQQGGKITVYGESGFWDGVVNNVPTSPAVGSRYIGGASGDSRITAQRVLSQSAGALAGEDKVLWASVVWHQTGSNYGRQVGFALGTDGLSNRSVNVDKTGNFGEGLGDAIGVGGAINSGDVTPTIWDNGNVVVRTTAGATTVSYSLDNLVVLKFTFADGATADTVTAYRFTESDTLSETTFDSSAISASSVIDQDTLNILSFSQSLVGNEAIDEIRLGDTFDDVIMGVTAPREPLRMSGIVYDDASDEVSLTWRSNPGELYGIYWSEDMTTFVPGVNPAVPAHATDPETTYGPFPSPVPNSQRLFFRIGPPDLKDPVLNSTWGSGSTITMTFSEAMHATAASDLANYTVVKNGSTPVTVSGVELSPDGKSVTLTLSAPLEVGTAYSVTMDNLTDLAGRPLGNATVGNFQTYDNNPNGVKVFILAGQSNMVGHGKAEEGVGNVVGAIGSLRYLAVNNASYPEFDYSRLLVDPANPATSAWKTRGDVKVWWRDSDVTAPRAVLKGDLKIGYADFRSATWFGPEYAFGWVMGDNYPDNPVLIIKAAWGGKSLHVDFRPPSAVAARGGVVGPYYAGMIEYVRDCLSNLGTEFPEFAGKGYQIAGFGWHQGWNDASYAAAYEDNLVDLIHDLRAEFGRPALPVVIGTTGMVGGPPEPYPYPGYTTTEKAQLAVADPSKHAEFTGTVFTVDTRPFWRDSTVSPSNFGYHWNHNGETHFLIGDAMGQGVVDLLGP